MVSGKNMERGVVWSFGTGQQEEILIVFFGNDHM
jgi:hypothetical protein